MSRNEAACAVFDDDWFMGRVLAERWLDGDAVVRGEALAALSAQGARTMAFAVRALHIRVRSRYGADEKTLAVLWEFVNAITGTPAP